MATSDGESCSAEDRALEHWRSKGEAAWCSLNVEAFRAGFRAGQEHGKPCTEAHADGWNYRQAVAKGWNAALESTRKQLEQMKDGAQAGKPPTVDATEHTGERKMREAGSIYAKRAQESDVEYLKRFSHTLEARMHDLERYAHTGELPRGAPVAEMRVVAPADSPLGVELSKIRDRLNALESSAKVHTSCINGQCERIERLEAWKVDRDAWELRQVQRIEKLEQHPERLGSSGKLIDRRVEACEDRLCAIEKGPYIDDHIVEHAKRLSKLESSVASGVDMSALMNRVAAIEAKLRLLEPIGITQR